MVRLLQEKGMTIRLLKDLMITVIDMRPELWWVSEAAVTVLFPLVFIRLYYVVSYLQSNSLTSHVSNER
jgi:hypothetical protein